MNRKPKFKELLQALKPWRYISYYSEYPIFEAAEGGYYYSGVELVWSELVFAPAARRRLKLRAKECECYDDVNATKYVDYDYLNSRYIGEGSYVTIELHRGADVRGYTPYE